MTPSVLSDSDPADISLPFRFPASYAQQRLWFIDQLSPGSLAYNMPVAVKILGPLEIESLKSSFHSMVRRHEALRTTFLAEGGEPEQVIHAEMIVDIPVVDLSGTAPDKREAEARKLVKEEAWKPFDLRSGPLLRLKLLRLGEQDHVLVAVLHHVISDGWSIGILMRELTLFYSAAAAGKELTLPELPVQYVDYTAWQREWLTGEALETQVEYWRPQLTGIEALELPADYPRPAVMNYQGAAAGISLSGELTERLKDLCRRSDVTLYMLTLAAFQMLLGRYTGQRDIAVGTPIAGRRRPELEELIGFFSNTLVLRTQLSGDASLLELLQQVKEITLQAYAHQDVPFEKLVEIMQPQRDLARTPLFQAMFVLQNTPQPGLRLGAAELHSFDIGAATAKFDLTLALAEAGASVKGSLGYSTALFELATIQRMTEHYRILLESMAAAPERPISELSLLSEAERRQLLSEWTRIEPSAARHCVHEQFARQAARRPEARAVSCDGVHLTYGELDRRANGLARKLQCLGVRPETRVALCLERSLEMIVGLLGVLKAGGAYVPLDPDFPSERLNYVLQDSKAAVLVAQPGARERFPQFHGKLLELQSGWQPETEDSVEAPAAGVTPQNAAYVIYTSGSTGRPKGVVVTHENVARLMERTGKWFGFNERDVVTLFHSYAFDFSVWELWSALQYGGRLVVVPVWVARAPEKFLELLRHERVTVLSQTPSAFQQLASVEESAAAEGSGPLDLRVVVFGGEALDYQALRRWIERHPDRPRLINMYGITETTVHVTYQPVSLAGVDHLQNRSRIGITIPDLQAYVLDEWMHPVPAGIRGELCVGGAGLARGYLERPDLTAERFVPHPFSRIAGERLYRSGDQASWRADGTLDYHGRLDQQVKIRGYRIEPGEIEAALREQPGVTQVAVIVREDQPGARRLVAYVVAEPGTQTDQLREELKRRVPDFMVPSTIVRMEALPLTVNGKLDRKSLPAPDRESAPDTYVAPGSPLEEQLAAIWCEVLNLDRVGVQDNFFDLGGHSLLATQVAARIRKSLAVEVPLRQLFESPTIAGLAAALQQLTQPALETDLVAMAAPEPANGDSAAAEAAAPFSYPASFAQQRLWFIDQLEPGLSTYNISSAIHIEGTIDVEVLRRSFQAIVDRHETLRTTFRGGSSEPEQVIWEHSAVELPVVSLAEVTAEKRESEARRLTEEESCKPFDLKSGPLLRVKLLRLSAQEYVLIVILHHIIADGWSLGVFMRELSLFYNAFDAHTAPLLPDLPVQYVDYTSWQREWLQEGVQEKQIEYWKKQLAGVSALDLPADRPRPPVLSYRGRNESVVIPAELTEKLIALGRQQGATLYMVLLAAMHALLYRYSGVDDIAIGSPIAGRRRPELEGLIGFFVNTMVLRAHVPGTMAFEQLLEQIKETTLQAYANQDVPFEKVVEIVQPERNLSRTPLFQVMLVLQNAPGGRLEFGSAKLESFPFGGFTAKFDLTWLLAEGDSGVQGVLGYATDLFEPATVRRMIDHYLMLMSAAADRPASAIGELPLMHEQEQRQILLEWNRTAQSFGPAQCVHEMFEEQARRTPQQPAVVSAEGRLTYAELNEKAGRLARFLQMRGVRPEARVGICLGRGSEMIVALLGVLKAGAAYVPIDPAYPQARLQFMIENSGIEILLTRSEFADLLPRHAASPVYLDTESSAMEDCGSQLARVETSPENLAYVIYTSGSTGKPKGVAMPHGPLSNLIRWQMESFAASAANTLQFTSLSFDVSFQEIFSTLASGGVLYLISEESRKDFPELLRQIEAQRIERLFLPFVALDYLSRALAERPSQECPLLEVITAGEQLQITPAVMQLFESNPSSVLVNHYGPTETHVATAHRLDRDRGSWPALPPIGRPIANSRAYIMNAWMTPSPVGVPGELYLGGTTLARGYLNSPELTAERFVPNPFGEAFGARIYKTGDLARWKAGGELEFLGRIDSQVKVRGYRIEPGEIEAALLEHENVEQAVVVVREVAGQKQLVAYIVPRQPAPPNAIQEALQRRLPEYMVPSIFVSLTALPLTPSGKIDRRSLPQPVLEGDSESHVAPQTVTEEKLARMWETLLGRKQISVDADFFASGGHSLLATQMVVRIRETFKVELPLRRIFEAPTITRLARVIEPLVQAGAGQKLPELVKVSRDRFIPLSYAQQRLWFIDQLTPGGSVYNVPAAVRIEGALNFGALQRALEEIVRRHESLRTTFTAVGNDPQQIIHGTSSIEMPLEDLAAVAEEEKESRATRLVEEEARRPFDLGRGPMMRVRLVRLSAQDHVLVVTMHHIVSDAWSIGILIREVSLLYEAFSAGLPSPLPELPIQYADYSVWQRAWLSGEVMGQQLKYWQHQLAEVASLDLPADHPRPPVMSYRGASVPITISSEQLAGIKELGRRQGVTLYMTLLAALQALLYRYTSQTDVAVGSPIAGRRQGELEGLIGFFINTLVLRAQVDPVAPFTRLLQQVKEVTLQAYAHQDVPFEKLVEVVQPERDMGRTPLFQVMLVLQNAPQSGLRLGEARLQSFGIGSSTAKFDLTLNFTETPSGLLGSAGYSTDLFDAPTIARMMEHYRLMLAGIVAEPERSAAELPLLSEAERRQALVEWTRAERVEPRGCIHELFEAQAARTPDARALSCGDEHLTYDELNRRANGIAHRLRRMGLAPETRVGLCVERSLEMVVALLGILKAGCAYVPLDPDYPPERMIYMLEDSQASALVARAAVRARLRQFQGASLEIETGWTPPEEQSGNPAVRMNPQNAAYVIYTSGSTGRPKGVVVTHGNVARLMERTGKWFGFNERDVVTMFHSCAFDFSVWELWAALHYGGRLAIVPYWVTRSPENFLELLYLEGVTILSQTPSAFQQLAAMDEAAPALPEDPEQLMLRAVILGGEALDYNSLRGWIGRHPEQPALVNMYGITETTVHVTYKPVTPAEIEAGDGRSGIGVTIPDLQAYVLDEWMQPVPAGVRGELYVGGPGLARGYLNRPELTALRFVPNPYSDQAGERLYRSGDQVSRRPDGSLDYHGRLDQQVKIRGFRIELGEIESALLEQAGVRQAAVVLRQDQAEDQRLVAYVAGAPGLQAEALREALKRRIPEYMTPAAIVLIDALPLTSNGKLDRRALPQPGGEGDQAAYVAPRTPAEEQLAHLWCEVLGLKRVSAEDNFFHLGGHSLLAVRLRTAIRNRMGRTLSLVEMFRNPTITQMAQALKQMPQESRSQALVPLQTQGEGAPFFCVHPIGGQVLCYAELVRVLGTGRPFYGLQSPVSADAAPLETVEQMAACYIAEVRRVQPSGPYLLGGWSMGGLIANEMARQLLEQGESIDLLAMFDTYPPRERAESDALSQLPMLARFALDMGRSMGKDVTPLQERFAALGPEEQRALVREELVRDQVLAADTAEEELEQLLSIFTRNRQAMDRYAPPPGDLRILLLKAAEGGNAEDIARQWGALALKGVDLQIVPGDHYSILQRPLVSKLVEKLCGSTECPSWRA